MKIAIVTGSSGNLGQAVVRKFIDEGYMVTGTITAHDPGPPNVPADRFEKAVVDVSNEADSMQFIESVISKYGKIDTAVLTIGGFASGSIAATSTSDVLKQYQLNFETAYNIARPVFIQMIKQNQGRIFFIGSRPGLDAGFSKGMTAYGLGKSLLFRLADLMNEEARGYHVFTSVVVPGTIDTPQNRKAIPGANFEDWVKPETLADVIYMHCAGNLTLLREPVIKVYGNS